MLCRENNCTISTERLAKRRYEIRENEEDEEKEGSG